jgi:hypothetical protein
MLSSLGATGGGHGCAKAAGNGGLGTLAGGGQLLHDVSRKAASGTLRSGLGQGIVKILRGCPVSPSALIEALEQRRTGLLGGLELCACLIQQFAVLVGLGLGAGLLAGSNTGLPARPPGEGQDQ